nr:class I SAM-dependent methyltransferase [Acidobacteriota bacterium]
VDGSARMLSLAAARLTAEERTRATFEHADARQYDPGPRPFDAIVTLFFLDCFVEHDVRQLVSRLSPCLRAGGIWLFADFAIPARAPARWHAQLVVNGLYLFFRWRAGLDARALPPSEAILQTAGLVAADQREYRAGLIRSVVYLRA